MILTKDDFTFKQKVRFNTHGLVGGASQFEGEVVGVISGIIAPTESNASTNHGNIYPALPTEVKNDIENNYVSYDYLVIKSSPTVTHYIGLPWIINTSVQLLNSVTKTVTLLNYTDVDDSRLRQLLTLNGFEIGTIT